MPRLFIRHKPVDCTVTEGLNAPHVFVLRRSALLDNGIAIDSFSLDLAYVCFAHAGVIWAARTLGAHPDSMLVRVCCVKLEDQPCVQQMLLADMILN